MSESELKPYASSRVVATIQGHVAEEEFLDSEGNVVGYYAYGSYDPQYPYQGDSRPTPDTIPRAWWDELKAAILKAPDTLWISKFHTVLEEMEWIEESRGKDD